MFRLFKRRPDPKPDHPSYALPVLTGERLLSSHAALVGKLRTEFGVSTAVWDAVHRQTLLNLAVYVQQLPASEAQYARPGGLLQYVLESALHTIRLRKAYMLPEGAAPDVVSEQQEVWSYAVLTATLLYKVGQPLVGTEVELTQDFTTWHRWRLLSGAMPPDHYYRVSSSASQNSTYYRAIPAIIASTILPKGGIDWLSQYPDVLYPWLSCTINQFLEAGLFGKILKQSDRSTVHDHVASSMPDAAEGVSTTPLSTQDISSIDYPLPTDINIDAEGELAIDTLGIDIDDTVRGKGEEKEVDESPATSLGSDNKELGQKFIDWLRASILEEQIGFNNASSHLHMVEEGLFLASPAIFQRYLRKHSQLSDDTDLRSVQRGFLGLALHKSKPDGSSMWTYSVHRKNPRRSSSSKIHGMLIVDPLKKLSLDRLPEINPLLKVESLACPEA